MRQVPSLDASPFGSVGNGCVARHFHHYFNLLGLSVSAWSWRLRVPFPPEALASRRTILLLPRTASPQNYGFRSDVKAARFPGVEESSA